MLSVVNNRHIFIIQLDDGSGRLVAMVEIGMGEVSGCQPTAVQTQFVRKGDELGYFAFGGSSYAMVFDKRFDLKFNEEVFVLDRKDRRGQPQPHLQKVNSLLCTFKWLWSADCMINWLGVEDVGRVTRLFEALGEGFLSSGVVNWMFWA